MKHMVFTIYDTKAKAYLTPFFMPAEGMAIRTFSDCVQDPNHQFGKHPEDFNLFNIGDYYDETGELIAQTPELVRSGLSLVEPEGSEVPPLKIAGEN